MASRPFPAKFESTCGRCGETIEEGMSVVFPERNSKEVVHEICPKPSSMAAAAIPGKPIFVQIAVWVHVEDVPQLADFIKKLRTKEGE